MLRLYPSLVSPIFKKYIVYDFPARLTAYEVFVNLFLYIPVFNCTVFHTSIVYYNESEKSPHWLPSRHFGFQGCQFDSL